MGCCGSTPAFTQILLENSHHDDLVQGSLYLLNRFYSSEANLFSKAIQTQLLVAEDSKKVFREIGQLLPTLRRYMSIDAGGRERAEIITIMQTFTKMCVYDEDKGEPHRQNQRILYNYGEVEGLWGH